MKKLILIVIVSGVFVSSVYGQTVKDIYDPTAVGQAKRQTFMKWGEWSPYSKSFLGIQSNIHYEIIWASLAPPPNKRYKNGSDIRPLSPTGLETQRGLLAYSIEKDSEKIEKGVDQFTDSNLDEYLHISKVGAKADLIYTIYYKRRLANLENINTKESFILKYIPIDLIQGIPQMNLEELWQKFEILKDKHELTFSTDMPRGKRILLYHQSFVDFRKLENYIKVYINSNKNYFSFKAKEKEIKKSTWKTNEKNKLDDKKLFNDRLRKENIW